MHLAKSVQILLSPFQDSDILKVRAGSFSLGSDMTPADVCVHVQTFTLWWYATMLPVSIPHNM